ncbi:MAG: hypothetical protein IPM64_13645 [Phycisphaerales bacterium]|nr:hypothetical protein [Phycisphaerales bacterium]
MNVILVRKPLILLVDALGALALLAVLAAGVHSVILPGWAARGSLASLREELNYTHRELAAHQASAVAGQSAIEQAERRMTELSAQPLVGAGRVLELLAEACRAEGVTLASLDPIEAVAVSGARVSRYQLAVSGAFPQVFSTLKRVEGWSAFVSFESLELLAPAVGAEGPCEVRGVLAIGCLVDEAPVAGGAR